ncbi:ras and Rab interactor 3 [Carassius carassius]|uniref:ras and Rab interactor 3 n=1 Tax=Carassius carassius TaxID=217509 RepID=UPI002868B86B|nr:ras and Rab interactor 3 [Carassius carassius]
MLSPGPSTAPSGLSKPSSPTISSPIQASFHPQTSPLPLSPSSSLTSTLTFPLVDISDKASPDPASHPLPASSLISCVQPSSPQLNSKSSSPPPQKPMSPQGPKPPLPAQLPSALPKSSSTALPKQPPPPPPGVRPSSSPQPRPPPPVVPKPQVPTSPVSKSNKPIPPGISILEKLIKTCPVWLQLGMKQDRAMHILSKEFPGIFLVRRDASQKTMILAVHLPDQLGEPHVKELPIKEEKSLLYLEGSVLVFENIFKLIAFYCVSRDILPFPLKLPQVIQKVAKYEDMEVISSLGSEFWNSALNSHEEVENIAGSCGALDRQGQSSSCEIQISIGSDRLWYVNPIFIEECSNSFPPTSSAPVLRTQSLNTPVQAPPIYKRPPPLRPRPPSAPDCSQNNALAKPSKGEFVAVLSSPPPSVQKREGSDCECADREQERQGTPAPSTEREKPAVLRPAQGKEGKQLSNTSSHRAPPIPIRRRLSEKQASEEPTQQEVHTSTSTEAKDNISDVPVASLICLDDSMEERDKPMYPETQQFHEAPVEESKVTNGAPVVTLEVSPQPKRPNAPVAPPRKKRFSQNLTGQVSQSFVNSLTPIPQESTSTVPLKSSSPSPIHHSLCIDAGHPKVSDVSLYSPDGGAPPDHDSYSTSSTEEEVDNNMATSPAMKRTPTIMLDRAKLRLSMVSMANLSNVLTGFMNADRKLQKRIVELSRDGNTYFGNLVKDYRAFTLDTMRKHTSSTEMLQEIRQMITQLKSYLIQSAELQNLQEAAGYSEEKLEIIIEAALCKSVLKPLREAVYNGLKDIHSRAGNLKKLKENQQVVQGTTTTDLGVTTSVPETAVMEKIQTKLGNLHQEYSPQKKIDLLLKTCKIIYESMSVGCPGKAHGADDLLPVLMYVLARCNISALLLDVEYMMELMDPALQLGEGSYYLTTTYGALEHIKNFDKQAVTRHLSLEIQDSIHRWERRRTLNKARASRSSVQDFINVSFLEAGSNTKTLGLRPNTNAKDLCNQCADKFEVLDPESYCLSVLVDGHYKPLAPEEFPLTIKSTLHHSEPRKEYYFVYRHGRWPEQESVDQTPSTPAPEESLI